MEFRIFLPLPIKINKIRYVLVINMVTLYWGLEVVQEPLSKRHLEWKLLMLSFREGDEPRIL